MTAATGAPVVAGVDGSAHQQRVIGWAVSEARLRNRPLVLVHAYDWARLGESFAAAPYGAVQEAYHKAATGVRDAALAAARDAAPDLDVTARVVDGGAAGVLVAASRSAALVVVGHRGRGGFAELLTGSVATQLAAHAAGPVVVVRPPAGEGPQAGRVVLGVDGSPGSAAAIDLAFEEAALRGLGVTAVHAWTGPVSTGPGDMLPLVYDVDEVSAEETRVLAEALAGRRERYPEVDVRRLVVRGRPAHVLPTLAAGAALLVVGARGGGGFAGLRLGSVSRAVLHHAPCPLAVVHRPAPRG